LTVPGQNRQTLLIVDDDAALVEMLSWDFEDVGYRVIKAHTLAEAAGAIDQDAVQLALLDHHLPDGLGCGFACTLLDRIPGLRVILTSADPAAAVCATHGVCPSADRICFIPKPLRPSAARAWFSAR
jgi:DNA-binding NtrC family response regulator